MLRWLCLAMTGAIAQIGPSTNSTATIAGRVTTADGGSPVSKARVALSQYQHPSSIELVATTDNDGRFRFADIEPGAYSLFATKPGYLPGANGQQHYDDEGSILRANAGQEISDISLRLFPASAIEGQVLDGDGDPASGWKVLLWSLQSRNHRARIHDDVMTDREGRYHFETLQPGTYLVSAEPDSEDDDSTTQIRVDSAGKRTNLHDYRTFFPASLTSEAAQPIRLTQGKSYEGADIHVQRGPLFSVAGRVAGAFGTFSGYQISISVDAGRGWTSKEGALTPDGSFTFTQIAPGKHHITLLRSSQNGLEGIGATDVEIGNADMPEVSIQPYEPATVRARVYLDQAAKPLTLGSVFLQPVSDDGERNRPAIYQFTPERGTYLLTDLAPGRYLAGFTNAPHCFLKSIEVGSYHLLRWTCLRKCVAEDRHFFRAVTECIGFRLDLLLYSPLRKRTRISLRQLCQIRHRHF